MNYVEGIKNRVFDDTSSSPIRAGVYARVSTRNESQKTIDEDYVSDS